MQFTVASVLAPLNAAINSNKIKKDGNASLARLGCDNVDCTRRATMNGVDIHR